MLAEKRIRDLYEKGPVTKSGQDVRTEFERDYDRAIFSAPVRRLQDKAQVFPLEPLDAVRTRLTHSLEVSTLSRDLGRQAAEWIREQKKEIGERDVAAISSIAATCGLIHDLGNPPFGHAGETAIQDWFKSAPAALEFAAAEGAKIKRTPLEMDFLLFEGNAQTIRIVSTLQVLSHEFGLNLTCGTMSALCKYVARSDEVLKGGYHEFKKPGYFASDQELISKIRDETGTGEARNPITYLVEAADDLIYATIDLEDGIKKGIVDWLGLKDRFLKSAEMCRECIDWAEKYIDGASVSLDDRSCGEALGIALRNRILTLSVPEVVRQFQRVYEQIMAGSYHGELVADSQVGPLIDACKSAARELIYPAGEVLRLEVMGKRVIQDLMTLFWEAVSAHDGSRSTKSFAGKLYNLMSANYRAVAARKPKGKGLPEKYRKLQLVTDYICGMTDTFACNLHRQLTNG